MMRLLMFPMDFLSPHDFIFFSPKVRRQTIGQQNAVKALLMRWCLKSHHLRKTQEPPPLTENAQFDFLPKNVLETLKLQLDII